MQPPYRKITVFRFVGAALLALMTLALESTQAANLQLRWQNTSASQTGVTIERQNGASYVQIASVAATAQSFSDTGLNDGTTYCYRVRAFNSAGPSPYSNTACGAARAAPLPPSSAPFAAVYQGITGADKVGRINQTSANGVADFHISVTGLRATPYKVRITSNSGGIWETPFNGVNWIIATQYDGSGKGDFWFEPFTSNSFRVKVTYADGSSDEADARNALTITPPLAGAPGNGTASPSQPTAAAPAAWSDYRLSLKMLSRDSQALGVIFRYQDPDNYYRFSWCGAGACRRLEKQVNGVFTTLAQDSGRYTTGRNYAVDIVAQDSRLQVVIDGAVVFSVSDATFASGSIGLYSNNNAGSSFDAVTVTDLNSGATLLAADFNDGTLGGWTLLDEGAAGAPSQWSAANGSLAQQSKIGSNDAAALGTLALYTQRSWKDIRARFKIKSDDDDRIGFMFRYQDSDNFYRFVWNKSTPGRRLLKKEKGVYSVLAEDAVPYVAGQIYQIEITAQGATLQLAIDGKPILSASDASLATGSIAFYSSFNQGSSYDDLLVEDLTAKAVLLASSFDAPSLAGWTIIDEAGTSAGPSVWSVVNGALTQASNIGSDATGHPGTFLLY